ncbi:hypothetical protein Ga0100231_006415 [Opitutaceae bacterium TAV4]|nr:hypothetical protein Ga0100231_006415 [Opitutaceae bacterium TAV4]RRK02626.1 hypothetical protein Ga0100230_005825 [Opitutaceae bacterium TAV3]
MKYPFLPRILLAIFGLAASLFVRAADNTAVDHSPKWSNNRTTLTYNLTDLDSFPVGSYRYCKWGNLQDRSDLLDVFNTDLFFTPLTRGPYSHANTDLFLADDSDYTLKGYAFPDDTQWWSNPNAVYLPGVSIPLRLYRYLHFNNELRDAATDKPLTGKETKLIILFHGWNPDSNSDAYAGSEFSALVSWLAYATTGTDWKVVKYRWEADSDTGDAISVKAAVNGTEAAEIGHQHGQHLGELLAKNYPDLQKVHVIAHSAGSWAARGTLRYLLENNSNVIGQLTLLDPFMPNAIVLIDSALGKSVMDAFDRFPFANRLDRLENYYANDIALGTQETFDWSAPNISDKRVDWSSYYGRHSGPIAFYTDTVAHSLPNHGSLPGLDNFDLRPNAPNPIGWNNSLFLSEPEFVKQPIGKSFVPGESITLQVEANTRLARLAGATSKATLSYGLFKDDGTLVGELSKTGILTIPSAKASDAGSYRVVAFDPTRPTNLALSNIVTLALDTKGGTIFYADSAKTYASLPSSVTKIVGDFVVAMNATISTSNLTEVVGSIQTKANATLDASRLTNVSGPIQAGANSSITAKALTKSGSITLGINASLTVASLMDVSGDVNLGANSTLTAPKLKTVSGDVRCGANSTLNAPLLTNNGGMGLVITAQPQSRSVWVGDSVTFTVSAIGKGKLAYQWLFNGKEIKGASGSSYTIAKIAAKNAGRYTVQVGDFATYAIIESQPATLTVNVPQKPKITLKPAAKIETGLGKDVTLTVVATGNPPPTYQWQFNGQNIPGATSATLTIAKVTAANLGKYTCVITSGPNKITSSATTVSAILPPVIDTPAPATGDITYALAAKGAKLSIKLAPNKAKPIYLWLLDGNPAPGANDKATYTAKTDGVYSVRVTNAAGTVEKKIANVKLITPPKIASIAADKTSIVAGESVTFTATLQSGTGTPPLTWTWLLNGKPIPGAPNAATYTAANLTAPGKYSVQVTNGAGRIIGRAVSKAVTIKVVVPPTITQQPVGATLVEGKATTLSVKATGTAKLMYQWYKDSANNPISGATKATLSLKAAKGAGVATLAGKYWVVVNNPANRPVKSNTVTLAAPAAVQTAAVASASGIKTASLGGGLETVTPSGAATLPETKLAPVTLSVGAELVFGDNHVRVLSETELENGLYLYERSGDTSACLTFASLDDLVFSDGEVSVLWLEFVGADCGFYIFVPVDGGVQSGEFLLITP